MTPEQHYERLMAQLFTCIDEEAGTSGIDYEQQTEEAIQEFSVHLCEALGLPKDHCL
mgnify:CR=1 FL=1